jgi:hypothetical protein
MNLAARLSTSCRIYGSAKAPVLFYVVDVMILSGRDVMGEPLTVRSRAP